MFLWTAAVAVADDELVIQFQHGYGNAQHFVVEGRVVEKRSGSAPKPDDSRLRNLWRNLRQLVNDEQDKVSLRVRFAGKTFEARTDQEGYFSVRAATRAANFFATFSNAGLTLRRVPRLVGREPSP